MTYSVGSTILHDDYNIFATGAAGGGATNSGNVNNIWGVGNSQYGWGQSTTVGAVSAANSITATQWSTLTSRINSIKTHQTGAGVSFTNTTGAGAANITAGQKIYQLSNLSSALSASYTAAGTATTTGGPAVYGTTTASTTAKSVDIGSQAKGSAGNTAVTYTFAWASLNAARYFFNAGGYLQFSWALTNLGTAKTQSWSNLLSDLGSIRFGSLGTAYTGSSGTFNTSTNYTFYTIPSVATRWFLKYNDTGVADYNSNYVDTYISISGSTITVTINYNDAAADTFGTWPNPSYRLADYINYPAVSTAIVYAPGTSYITDTWGTVTVT